MLEPTLNKPLPCIVKIFSDGELWASMCGTVHRTTPHELRYSIKQLRYTGEIGFKDRALLFYDGRNFGSYVELTQNLRNHKLTHEGIHSLASLFYQPSDVRMPWMSTCGTECGFELVKTGEDVRYREQYVADLQRIYDWWCQNGTVST